MADPLRDPRFGEKEPFALGVEEELFLVDPGTRLVSARSRQVLKEFREHRRDRHAAAATDALDQELFRHQLETRTTPLTDLTEVREHLVRQRRAAAGAAEGAGVLTAATGTTPVRSGEPQVSQDDRYLTMLQRYGEIARGGGICAMHVHVGIDSDEQAVTVVDALAPWLPLLLAISANSPYSHGRDTGYHSWRSQEWARWPSAGPTERFGSVERYREVCRWLIDSGAALDPAMLYFDARLSAGNPTVEVRITDVCADPDDALLVTALVRGLVMWIADLGGAGTELPVWRTEMLQAAKWRAARHGLSDALICPTTAELAPARDVLSTLVATVREPLEACGDLALVEDGLDRVLAGGGASRQRAAYERSGGDLQAVVDDLVTRTNACWQTTTS